MEKFLPKENNGSIQLSYGRKHPNYSIIKVYFSIQPSDI